MLSLHPSLHECPDPFYQTRQLVGDIMSGFTKVEKLYAEAEDGAKRCLLDYTLQRTQQAEAEAESVLALIVEVQADGGGDDGSTAQRAQRFESENEGLRDAAAALSPAVEELVAKATAAISTVGAESMLFHPSIHPSSSFPARVTRLFQCSPMLAPHTA